MVFKDSFNTIWTLEQLVDVYVDKTNTKVNISRIRLGRLPSSLRNKLISKKNRQSGRFNFKNFKDSGPTVASDNILEAPFSLYFLHPFTFLFVDF